MLPFDNKNEFQVIVDMPEGSTLEQTAAVTRELAAYVATMPEVANYQMYVGTAAPYNFNGLVRHYFLRRGSNVADIQVNLTPKDERSAQSHDITKRVRPVLQQIARKYGANVKIAEVPPGPPVLQTIVAEVYGPRYDRQIEIARSIREILEQTEGVVDVDWFVEDNQQKYNLKIDKEKAALNGISAEQITQTIRVAVGGLNVGILHLPNEKEDTYINLRLPRSDRSSIADIEQIKVVGNRGNLVPVSELVQLQELKNDKSIYHKNLMPVVYVTADVGGTVESPVYAILGLNDKIEAMKIPEGYSLDRYVASQPLLTDKYSMKWDGEWHITYELFRDLGLAFAVVMVLIYILVVGWFQSFKTPLTIMAAIPFSLIGILPAHALMGAFFTAPSMVGLIAGAGIVVRNSIILVDFVELRIAHGMSLVEAVVDAGAVRFRPMMLTAAAVIVGSSVMLFDPIFQGLAISLMAGELASLLLSRMAVPVLYYLSERSAHKDKIVRSDIKTVLCPTDFSPQSAIAVKFAAAIASVFGAKMTVLHASEADAPSYFTDSQLDEMSAGLSGNNTAAAETVNEFVRQQLGQQAQFDSKITEAEPTSAILRETEKADTILIALGTHGRSGFEEIRFGSVAGAILRDCSYPVLTVNPCVGQVETPEIKRIFCPVDMSPGSENSLRFAAELANRFNAEIVVVNIVSDEKNRNRAEDIATLCSWISGTSRQHCDFRELVRQGDISQAVIKAAGEFSADLIVMGCSHGVLTDQTFGQKTSEILRNAQCPVITVSDNRNY
jgi:nucleotide-binding universal stress UspA family protein